MRGNDARGAMRARLVAEEDFFDLLAVGEVGGIAADDQPPAFQHVAAVGHGERQPDVLLDEQDRNALLSLVFHEGDATARRMYVRAFFNHSSARANIRLNVSNFLFALNGMNDDQKRKALDILLDQLMGEDDRKVILFSEWTRMLDLVEPLLERQRLDYVRLDPGRLTESWIALDGNENTPGDITIGGFNTTALGATESDTLGIVVFWVEAEGEDEACVDEFADDFAGAPRCCDLVSSVTGSPVEPTSWGLVKARYR